ncbi:citrate/2-methylcitrate synthase [Treponema brennaborense]|uniref:Citrate synthase n=1 Tax=Treponema brennaborense (strain DSM 12168 / CIP 105900 / DD5/3) TaxID=906968 RepID=F4LL89_TREBD|nr:citrate/2-methylcitrate synthase [Treponema brennaborense]AEE15567.1 Citrate synthase [Treponema brennaborense DSM 12168]
MSDFPCQPENGVDSVFLQNKIAEYSSFARSCSQIDPDLYTKYEVKRGLRDISGKGVLAGLTEISEVLAYVIEDGDLVPCDGRLFYRGYDIRDLVDGFLSDGRFGFEEVCFLLLFGHLPSADEYAEFRRVLSSYMSLPDEFLRNTIMNAPGHDMMNQLATSVLTLYTYDSDPEDISIPNVLRQCLRLIAQFPSLMVYGFQSYAYYYNKQSLIIHSPDPQLSAAENILHMLHPDSRFTPLEARILDLALVLHAEHGGGNNSTFTNHVVTSSGTDTYSAMASSLCSLKGPRHGGANIKVMQMFDDMKTSIRDWHDDDEICAYIEKLLDKQAFDKSGLVYGIGHAVYSLSDPRALIFRGFVEELAEAKNAGEEYLLYSKVETLAPRVISRRRKMYKGVSANIDFYSGFVYRMLGLPPELYTPLFATARMAGWSAHRIEELSNNGKIIRPAYKSVSGHKDYVPMAGR